MRKLLSHPATNAICISLFSAFYAIVFFISSKSEALQAGLLQQHGTALGGLSLFLYNGRQAWVAWGLIALTLLVVVLLLRQQATYDEYHTAILTQCLLVAMVLVLLAIAVLFASVVLNPVYIIEKFMVFSMLHWATVVLADLVYVLFFRR